MQPDPDNPCLSLGVFFRGELVRVVDEPEAVRRLIERAKRLEAQQETAEERRQARRRQRRAAERAGTKGDAPRLS